MANSYESFRKDVIAGLTFAVIVVIILVKLLLDVLPKVLAALLNFIIAGVLAILGALLGIVIFAGSIYLIFKSGSYFYRLGIPRRCRRKIERLETRIAILDAKIANVQETILGLHPNHVSAANAKLQELLNDRNWRVTRLRMFATRWKEYRTSQLEKVRARREKKIYRMVGRFTQEQISDVVAMEDDDVFILENEIRAIESNYGISPLSTLPEVLSSLRFLDSQNSPGQTSIKSPISLRSSQPIGPRALSEMHFRHSLGAILAPALISILGTASLYQLGLLNSLGVFGIVGVAVLSCIIWLVLDMLAKRYTLREVPPIERRRVEKLFRSCKIISKPRWIALCLGVVSFALAAGVFLLGGENKTF